MDIAKPRIAAALAGLIFSSVVWSAEAPTRDASKRVDVPRAVQMRPAMQGLNNPALKLTDSQRARIESIVTAYLAEEKALANQYSAPDAKRGVEAASASKQARERMMAAVDQVLDASQRNTLKAEQAEQKVKLAEAMQAAHPGAGPSSTALRPAPAGTDQPRGR